MNLLPRKARFCGGLLAFCALSLIATGCAATRSAKQARWEGDFYYTHRLHIDGQHGLAAQRYDTLADRASGAKDRHEAALMSCEAMRRGRAFKDAADCFDGVATRGTDRNLRTRALLHAAQIRYDDLDKKADALLMFSELVARAPDTPAGLRALDWLTRDGRSGPEASRHAVQRMVKLERRNPRSPLADNLLLRSAMLLHERGTDADKRRAVGLLVRMQTHHRHSSALLPGLLLRAKLHRGFGEPVAEARALQAVVATHETSYVIGTYLEPAHMQAMERLVFLYSRPLRQPDRAEAVLDRLRSATHKPLRRYRYLALMARLREQRGDRSGALSMWRELLANVDAASKDMRRNDERICREDPDKSRHEQCLQAVRSFGPLPVKEVEAAHAAIARLAEEPARTTSTHEARP